jgi:oligopeptide transport system substrate-binding protein
VLRVLAAILLIPALSLLVWLGLGSGPERADFVFTAPEPRTLDPHRVSWIPEIQIANALFEGLTRLNPVTLEPEPAVADSWQTDAEGRSWTFHLRRDARWSNGEPLVAEHFRFAWLRVLDPKVAAQYASLLFVIDGAERYYCSRLNDDPTDDEPAESVGVRATDDRTLLVRLSGPCPFFLDLTAFPTFAPVHPATIERFAYRDGQVLRQTQHLWVRPEHLVCNGAFRLARWEFKRSLWLTRNPYYYAPETVWARSIEVYATSDPGAALLAYETGRVDLTRGLELPVARILWEQLQAGRRKDFHIGDRFATFFYRVNCRRPPLDDPDVRRALSLAVDRERICRHVLGLGEMPAVTYVPPSAIPLMARTGRDGQPVLYQPPAGLGAGRSYAECCELAREYLRRHLERHPGAKGLRPIEIAFSPEPEQRRIAEALQQMWESALGIRVELRTQEAKVLAARIRDLDYDLARSDWYGDYLDPATFLNMFRTDDGQNRTGWSDAQYDRLVGAAANEADNEKRYRLLGEAEEILCREVPIIPLFHRRGNYLLRPGFSGISNHVRDLLVVHRAAPAGEAQGGTEGRLGISEQKRRDGLAWEPAARRIPADHDQGG